MSTFAFITVQGGGNLPPQVAIAQRLRARGHDVHLLGDPQVAWVADAMGAVFTQIDEIAFWDPTRSRSVVAAIGKAARVASDRAARTRIRDELLRLRPDVAVADPLPAISISAARDAGLRTAALFHTFPAYWLGNYARGPVGLLSALRGTPLKRTYAAADLRIVVGDAELDPSPRTPEWVWTGSCETGVPAVPGDPPRILISLSTIAVPGQTDVYRRVIAAMRDVATEVTVTTGGQALPVDLEVPPNVQVHARIPHAELLPHLSAVIGHGGYSTTLRALAHDVPLLILPLHPLLDQQLVGAAVADSGAGLMLRRTASPKEIAEAVNRLLREPRFRDSATVIGERLRSVDGASNAADALEELAGKRRG